MLDQIVSGLSNLALRRQIRDDDGIDQLHHFVTVAIFAFFAAITGVKQFAGEPINCWVYGDYLMKQYQDHVNEYCWTQSLYVYPNSSDRSIMPYPLNKQGGALFPGDANRNGMGEITFYRWVTIIFVVQAFFFKLPNVMWSEFNAYAGSNIVKMVEMLQQVVFAKMEDKKEKVSQVAVFLEQWLRIHRKPYWFRKATSVLPQDKHVQCCMLCIGRNLTDYLSGLYLLVKALFLINVILQFFIISGFLQLNYWNFGVDTLRAYADDSKRVLNVNLFPLVSLCHFQTYDLLKSPDTNGAQGKWIQCILTINLFLEKLFLIEWFWLLMLLVLTSINFAVWCFKILQTHTAKHFVESFMRVVGSSQKGMPAGCSVDQFVTEYLRSDGVFVLRILTVNTNEVVVAKLVEELWKRYIHFEDGHPGIPVEEAETVFAEHA